MNMQSDNIEDLFREKLSGFQAETTPSFDSRMMDSIINHSAELSKWKQFTSKWGKAAAGLVTGAALTATAFLARDWQQEHNARSMHIAQVEQPMHTNSKNGASAQLAAFPQNENGISPAGKINRNNLASDHSNNSTRRNLSAIQENNDISEYENSNNRNVGSGTSNTNNEASSLESNTLLAMADPQDRKRTIFPIAEEMDQVCYTNVGYSDESADLSGFSDLLTSDLPALSKEVKQQIKRQSVELSAGLESYGQKNIEGKQTEIDIQKATLLYCAELNNIELKTGLSVSQFGRERQYDYSYFKTDTTDSWLRVDSVDANGQQIGKMQYDTVSNIYANKAAGTVTDYRLSIPLLIGYKLNRGKFTASLFAGAEYYFFIAQSSKNPDFQHDRVTSFSEAGENSKKNNLALVGQMQIGFFATTKVQLFANGEYRRYLKPLIDNGQNQKQIPSVSANVGIKVYF